MDPDPPSPETFRRQQADALFALVSGPLAAAEAALASHSRPIPSGRDFHYYNSFDQFRTPTKQILAKAQSLLTCLASPSALFSAPPPPEDAEDALEWVVDLNDEFLERFGASLDEFDLKRTKLEEKGGVGEMEEDGFQVVHGKKKKKRNGVDDNGKGGEAVVYEGAKVLVRDKVTGEMTVKVPFHIPSIERPQDEYKILVNNSNQPFEHVWLERSDDGLRFEHPLEKLSVTDFIDRENHEPVNPLPLERTPFKLVEDVKALKELAIKLRDANEFAIDLEHNQYRSFQGLTCLMQISTRTEDFVVDTLKLRIQIGPHLREIFKDPSKRKVMHGADRDILWLQRDFGIYVCNLFDTGQASRVLQLERNSLEYLLHHYCGVTANKVYQNAEWRLRPIPDEMLKYAREDTHYLLYLYDLMRQELITASTVSENGDALLEVYKRSYDVCMQLYEKELLTDTSYLYIYGLYEADFNSQQLAVAAALYEWRDNVARAEDESTGYVLPNRALLEIARRMPQTANRLRRLVQSKHPLVERYLGSVVSIIKGAIQNASAFECISEQLKKERLKAVPESEINDYCKDLESHGTTANGSPPGMTDGVTRPPNVQSLGSPADCASLGTVECIHKEDTSGNCMAGQSLPESRSAGPYGTSGSIDEIHPSIVTLVPKLTKGVNIASVQALKKPTGGLGALLGSSSKQRLNDESRKSSSVQEVAKIKLEEIKSTVSLPFHYFSGLPVVNVAENSGALQSQPSETRQGGNVTDSSRHLHSEPSEILQEVSEQHDVPKFEEIISLGGESDDSQQSMETAETADIPEDTRLLMGNLGASATAESMPDAKVTSLAELSSSLEKCFNPSDRSRSSSERTKKPQESRSPPKVDPFDYATARKQVSFGRVQAGEVAGEDGEGRKSSRDAVRGRKGSGRGTARKETSGTSFQHPRRRQAFPPSGNRNATFR